MRKLLIAVALLLGVVFVIARLAEVEAIWATLQRGDLRFILLAGLVLLGWLVNIAASYHTAYQLLGLDERLKKLLVLSILANFVNVVAPSAGMGGMAVFISDARRRGYSAGRVTVAGVLVVLFDYLGLLVTLAAGLLVLLSVNHLTTLDLIASAILLLIAAVLTAVLYLAMRSEVKLGRLLIWAVQWINRLMRPLIKRRFLSKEYAWQFAHEAAAGLQQIRRNPKRLWKPAVLALSNKLLLILILFLVCKAFQVSVPPDTLIASFSIAYLFVIVSPTPSGVGFVEGFLTLTMHSLGIPLSEAAVISLAYRGITFWTPLLLGMLAFRLLPGGGLPGQEPAPLVRGTNRIDAGP